MRPPAWVELLFGWLELPQLLGPGVYLFWVLVFLAWLAAVLGTWRRWGRRAVLWIGLSVPAVLLAMSFGSFALVLWLCSQPPGCFSAGL